MIRYKVKNCIDKDKDVILEIEEEFTNTLLNGLNISVTDFESDSLISFNPYFNGSSTSTRNILV